MSYSMPATLDDLIPFLQHPEAQIVAGGTDYFPARAKGTPVGHLIDVTRVAEMQGISRTESGWRFGAAVTWAEVVGADLPLAFDGLKAAAAEVGSIQIQNVATLAGNLCNASPAADGVPALLVLGAEVELCGADGYRRLPLEDFIIGVRQTALMPGEVLTALHFEDLPPDVTGYFAKLGSRRYLVISITMAAGVIGVDAQGRIDFARLAVGACSAVAQRQPALEAAVIGQAPQDVAIEAGQLENLSPIDDVRGDAAFRLASAAAQLTQIIRGAS